MPATLLAAALATVPALPLHAQKTDVVTLRNGDAITGEVKELQRGLLKYSTDDMGTIYIEWNRLARVTSRNYFEVELESGLKYFGTLDPPAQDGKVVVSLVVPDTLELLEIVQITRIKATFWSRLSGFVDVGFSYAKANKNGQFTASGEVKYRGRKWAGSLKGESYFQDQESSDLTSRNSLSFTIQRFLGNKWAAGGNVGAEQNQELQLEGRFSVGAGVWGCAARGGPGRAPNRSPGEPRPSPWSSRGGTISPSSSSTAPRWTSRPTSTSLAASRTWAASASTSRCEPSTSCSRTSFSA